MASQPAAGKSQLLKDLTQRVAQLQQVVQAEHTARVKLDTWITSSLRPGLQKLQRERQASEKALLQRIVAEQQARAKLTAWIKEHIGPRMEHLDARIDQRISNAPTASARSTTTTSTPAGAPSDAQLREQIARVVAEEVSKHMQKAVREAELDLARAADQLIRERLASVPAGTSLPAHQYPQGKKAQPQAQAQAKAAPAAVVQKTPQRSNAASSTVQSAAPSSKPVAPNVEKEVVEFLARLGCEQYLAEFQTKGYWTLRLVKQLRADDLPELGINAAKDREAILSAVQKLNGQPSKSQKKSNAEKASGGGIFGSITGWFGGSSEPEAKKTISAAQQKRQSSSDNAQDDTQSTMAVNQQQQQQQQQQQEPSLNEPDQQQDQHQITTATVQETRQREPEPVVHSPRRMDVTEPHDDVADETADSLVSPRDSGDVDDLLCQAAQSRAPVLRTMERAGSTSIRGRRPPTRKNLKLGSTVAVKVESVDAPKPSYDPSETVTEPEQATAAAPRRLPPGATAGPGLNLAAAAAAKLNERRAAAAAGARPATQQQGSSATVWSAPPMQTENEEGGEETAPVLDAAARRREELAQRAARAHQSQSSASVQMFVPSENASVPRFLLKKKKTKQTDAENTPIESSVSQPQQPEISELERKMQARRSGSATVSSSKPTTLREFLLVVGCPSLLETFSENGFDDMSLIEELTEEDLDDLDIMDQSQRSALLKGVQDLKNPTAAVVPTFVQVPQTSAPQSSVPPASSQPAAIATSSSSSSTSQAALSVAGVPPPSTARMLGDLGEPTSHIMPSVAIQRIRENDPSLKHLILSQGSTFQMKSIEYAKQIASALKSNSHLIILELAECNITDAGAQALGEALKVNRALEKLDLGRNKIGSAGLTGLAQGLTVNRTLRELILLGQSQMFGEPALRAVLNMLEKNFVLQTIQWRIDSRQSFAINKRLTRNRDAGRLERTGKTAPVTSSVTPQPTANRASDQPSSSQFVPSTTTPTTQQSHPAVSTAAPVAERTTPPQTAAPVIQRSPAARRQVNTRASPASSTFDASSIFGGSSTSDWATPPSNKASPRVAPTSASKGLFDPDDRNLFASPSSPATTTRRTNPNSSSTSSSSSSSSADGCSSSVVTSYTSAAALSLAKPLGLTPPQIADALVKEHTENRSDLDAFELSTSSRGFLTVELTDRYLLESVHQLTRRADPRAQQLNELLHPELVLAKENHSEGSGSTATKKTVVIDYPSPNFGKELHVGHLRSMAIGESLARILRYCGHEVVGHSHVGDFGMPMSVIIAFLLEHEAAADNPSDRSPDYSQLSATALSQLYVRAQEKLKKDLVFEAFVRDVCLRLQQPERALDDGEKQETVSRILQIWQQISTASRTGFAQLYADFGIHAEERPESSYRFRIPAILEELKQKELLIREDNDALLLSRLEWESPLILCKQDGSFTYAATDVATIHYRLKELAADWLIYVTDASQRNHFSKIFDTSKLCGWLTDQKLSHAYFGLVKGENNKRLKSRSGEALGGSTPLGELVELICERLGRQWPDLRDEALLRRMGVSCCLYSELSHHRTMDYRLSLENSIALKGNSYPYVNYAYSRIESLLGAVEEQSIHISDLTQLEFTDPCERELASQLVLFDDVVVRVANELLPHLLCDYVYELATLFHRFYSTVRILDAERPAQRQIRLLLSVATRNTLRQSLDLLAVQPIRRM